MSWDCVELSTAVDEGSDGIFVDNSDVAICTNPVPRYSNNEEARADFRIHDSNGTFVIYNRDGSLYTGVGIFTRYCNPAKDSQGGSINCANNCGPGGLGVVSSYQHANYLGNFCSQCCVEGDPGR